MNYRIETKDAFRIVGVSVPLHKDIEKNFSVIPQKWQEISTNGTLQRLTGMMDTPPMGVLGVSTCNDTQPWRYYIAVCTSQKKGDLEEYVVPAAAWAVFPGEGTNQSIQELERRIVTEWLPTSGYEYGNAPDVEVYISPDPQNAKYEVWIPVVKKQPELWRLCTVRGGLHKSDRPVAFRLLIRTAPAFMPALRLILTLFLPAHQIRKEINDAAQGNHKQSCP